jgi:hypothetical protein
LSTTTNEGELTARSWRTAYLSLSDALERREEVLLPSVLYC